MSWFVEGDIKGFFDNIDHHYLKDRILEHFDDTRLMNLYWKLVKAGYVEWDGSQRRFVPTDLGVPQGGIISPLLSNLVLHKLDLFIEEIKLELDEKNNGLKPSVTNPFYHKLTMRIHRLEKKLDKGTFEDTPRQCRRLIAKLKRQRALLKSTRPNPKYAKIEYVRYADD